MRYLLFLTIFSFVITNAQAQRDQDNIISVTASGEVEVPADIIQFNINLNAEADKPQEAYDLHKKREKVLVQLLDKYDIKEEYIRFEPVSIQKNYTDVYVGQQRKEIYRTSQQVSLKLKDFNVYEKIQVTLVENDFDQFNGNFLSSEQHEGEDEALRQALKEARNKASIIARETGVKLGNIRSIHHSESRYVPSRQMESMAMAAPDSPGLMKYEQTVILQASVTIHFNIQ